MATKKQSTARAKLIKAVRAKGTPSGSPRQERRSAETQAWQVD